MRHVLLILSLAALIAPAAFAQPADLVILNAKIWTGEIGQPRAEAFAVRDGRFIFVGDEAGARERIGDATEVLDAEGKRILPGLIDAHVHLGNAATSLGRLDLRPATSREHLLQLVRVYAMELGPDDWLLGRGWSAESWPDPTPPTPQQLDDAAGGRPAILTRMDGHSLIAGAEAMRRAGVTSKGPPDPPGGRIGRRDDGEPTGAFFEQAMGIVTTHAPPLSKSRTRELLNRAIAHANSVGLTQVGAIDTRSFIQSHLVPLDREGELTLRIGATITGEGDALDEWTPALEWAAANRELSPRVRVLGFKGYMDGSLGSRTAWMTEPYLDDPDNPDNAGFPLAMAESGELRGIIRRAATLELQPAVHAIGDRANQQLLNWYQFLGPESWMIRPRIEHAQHLLPADYPRIARLSVVASMQPLHKADDGRYAEARIGPERVKSSYAFRSLLDHGVTLAFGSDWPVVSCNPFLGIHAAVSAQTLAGDTFVPEQSITVDEALQCYTRHSAYALFSDRETGAIQPDLFADFIILDRDILNVPHEEIPGTRVLSTYLEGELIHADEADNEER